MIHEIRKLKSQFAFNFSANRLLRSWLVVPDQPLVLVINTVAPLMPKPMPAQQTSNVRIDPGFFVKVIGICFFLGGLIVYTQSLSRLGKTLHQRDATLDGYDNTGIKSSNSKKKTICESAKPLFGIGDTDDDINERALLEIQHQADLFHNQGGNLKFLQEFLDAHIDSTYKDLGVEYTPKGPDNNSPSMLRNINNDFKQYDTKQRGGYEQRQPEGRFNKIPPGIMQARGMVDVIEPIAGVEKWKVAMGPEGPKCQYMHTIHPAGRKTYEDKYMCNYKDYLKQKDDPATSTSTEKKKDDDGCNIISIGSNDEWGFETVVTQETICVTHTFDCTIKTPKRKPDSDAVNFYSACISAEDKTINDRLYQSYSTMLQRMGVTVAPTFLKMDVEGFEFDTLTAMLQEDVLRQEQDSLSSPPSLLPQQISIELHYFTRMYDLPWSMRARQTGELSMLFGIMYRLGGYLPVHYDFDPGCASCLEVLFVRIYC